METSDLCSECGNTFSKDELITFQNANVCAACKPVLIQKIKEGITVSSEVKYAGFWIRFGAKFIDWVILGTANMLVNMIFGFFYVSDSNTAVLGPAFWLNMIVSYSFAILYTTWLLGKYSATLGKMACGLKVVISDGSQISYSRAFGRYFGELLSGFILCIGYLMAGFDDEKRTLHDRVCNTRVVHK